MFILMAYVITMAGSSGRVYYDYMNKSEHTTIERCQNAAKIMGYERFHCVPK